MATQVEGWKHVSEIAEGAALKAREFNDVGMLMQRATKKLISAGLTLPEIRRVFDRHSLIAALDEEGGNVCRTARKHKIHRNTVSRQKNELCPKVLEGPGGEA